MLTVAAVVLLGVGLGFGAMAAFGSDDDDGKPSAGRSEPARSDSEAPGGPGDGPSAGESPGPSPSDSAPDAARTQAEAVDALLDESAQDRETVIDAVGAVDACDDPQAVSDAVGALSDAADRRDDLAERLGGLALDEVDGGEEAAAHLRTAWEASADADRAFADWAATMSAGGCTGGSAPHDSDYDRGVSSSGDATEAKQDFVRAWNPIAEEHGLEARSADAL